MVLKADKERVRTLLKDTITLLCKNGLTFKSKFSIDAVIGVTLDEDDAFYVSMNEIVKSDIAPPEPETSSEDEVSHHKRSSDGTNHKRRKRRKHSGQRSFQSASSGSEEDPDANSPPAYDQNRHIGGDDSNTYDGSSGPARSTSKHNVKRENEDTGDDIMFIKQELSESWAETTDPGGHFSGGVPTDATNFLSASQAEQFDHLSGSSLIPVSSQGDGSMWLSPSQGAPTMATQGLPGGPQPQILYYSPKTTKKLECDICHKEFSQRWYLNRHKIAHSGQYPHHCRFCNKGVFTKTHLENHISSHHRDAVIEQDNAKQSVEVNQQSVEVNQQSVEVNRFQSIFSPSCFEAAEEGNEEHNQSGDSN